jgi:hypothetical protein
MSSGTHRASRCHLPFILQPHGSPRKSQLQVWKSAAVVSTMDGPGCPRSVWAHSGSTPAGSQLCGLGASPGRSSSGCVVPPSSKSTGIRESPSVHTRVGSPVAPLFYTRCWVHWPWGHPWKDHEYRLGAVPHALFCLEARKARSLGNNRINSW